ncbi:TPA: hypothetical protein SI878_004400 [Salmonella enterica]|nr:hypothetical protein [Salmonella enterica]
MTAQEIIELFDLLTDNQKETIQRIFDLNYQPEKPDSIYKVMGLACAYVITERSNVVRELVNNGGAE